MTDFDKVKAYYATFDEQHRLEKNEGRLEYEITLSLLLKYLNKNDNILDLGGGAGKYSIELARQGYQVTLADLSERLLKQAEQEIISKKFPVLKSIDQVNAIDLSGYRDGSFDAVILFGPLYHLLEATERNRCVAEVFRVMKKNGTVFASFIPYLSGAAGIVSRALDHPDQVGQANLAAVFKNGSFRNNADRGFQEGYYPTSKEIKVLFKSHGFTKILLRSIRSFGYNKEEKLYSLLDDNHVLFNQIIDLIHRTSEEPAFIETCGHALYVGQKNG